MAPSASFLDRVLEPPRYGWSLAPDRATLWRELFHRVNVLHDRRNWLQAWVWGVSLALEAPAILYLARFFSWGTLLAAAPYGLVILPFVHNTFWLHRYCTHHSFSFRNRFWLAIARNLTWRFIPEETYVLSHHVHHARSERPGDPYNATRGWLYCFLADAIHQGLARDLAPADYARAARMMAHTGVRVNSYEEYRRWGTIEHPARRIAADLGNWAFWGACFYLAGGLSFLLALCFWATFWNWGIRTFNYRAHGGGRALHREGRDFHRGDLSVNLPYPGYVAGEWHNNHHLLPGSARSGYLSHQLDLPWLLIRAMAAAGIVTSYRDLSQEFFALARPSHPAARTPCVTAET